MSAGCVLMGFRLRKQAASAVASASAPALCPPGLRVVLSARCPCFSLPACLPASERNHTYIFLLACLRLSASTPASSACLAAAERIHTFMTSFTDCRDSGALCDPRHALSDPRHPTPSSPPHPPSCLLLSGCRRHAWPDPLRCTTTARDLPKGTTPWRRMTGCPGLLYPLLPAGPVLITHFTLLLGMAAPIWLSNALDGSGPQLGGSGLVSAAAGAQLEEKQQQPLWLAAFAGIVALGELLESLLWAGKGGGW